MGPMEGKSLLPPPSAPHGPPAWVHSRCAGDPEVEPGFLWGAPRLTVPLEGEVVSFWISAESRSGSS